MAQTFFISIDLGGTNLKIALLDSACRIKDKKILSTRHYRQKSALIATIGESVRNMRLSHSLHLCQIRGVGIGLPGPIDFEKGIVHFFPNIPGWKQVPLRSMVRQIVRLPVVIDNDANLMTLAEQRLGCAAIFSNVVGLTLGTGVGGGIIIEGKLYRGGSFAAGEIGHVPLNEQGPRCKCSGKACLEAYIGNTKILSQARKIFGASITLEQLSAMAKRGNTRARGIWSGVGFQLGVALSGIVNVLNPDCIVIGGGVAEAGSVLFDKVKETISLRALKVASRHVHVRKAALGSDAGMIGAAILVKEQLNCV